MLPLIFISLVWGLIPIIIKIYLSFLPYIFIIFIQGLVLLFSSLIYIYFFKFKEIKEGFGNITIKKLLILILTFFFASFICNLLYLDVLKRYHISAPIIIFTLTPAITILASYLILGEFLNFQQLFGCLLIFIGIFFIFYYKNPL
jgi:drug/metabolite transporter (DMT)-like permease